MASKHKRSTMERVEIAALDKAEQQSPSQDPSLAVFGRDVDSYDTQSGSADNVDATVQDWAVAEESRAAIEGETADGLDDLDEQLRRGAEELPVDEPLEERIRRKAYELWESEGGPHGRAEDHWRIATEMVAQEDAERSALLPFGGSDLSRETGSDLIVEDPSIQDNLGEFPGLTDQGDETDEARPDRTGD